MNTKQVFGLSNFDLVPGKYEGDDVLLLAFLSMKHTQQTWTQNTTLTCR